MTRPKNPNANSNAQSAQQIKDAEDRKHVHKPFKVSEPSVSSGGEFGAYRPANGTTAAHNHGGNDYPMDPGTELYAMVKSRVTYVGTWSGGDGNLITLKALEDRGSIKKGDQFGYGSSGQASVTDGQTVEAGQKIGVSGNMLHGSGVHLWMQRPAGEPGGDGNFDSAPYVHYTYGGSATESGSTSPSSGNNDGSGASNASNNYTTDQIAKGAAFSTILSFPSAVNSVESNALTGQRSMLNDEPLFPFIEQICGASLRNFMSMPDGKFYAFYPDYFGGFHRQPYWNISDIEIISGKIDLSDDNLATHVFVVGDTQGGEGAGYGFGTIDYVDEMNTTGVINIFNAFQTGFLNGKPSDGKSKDPGNKSPDELDKEGAINFLKKYGARKYMEPVAAVRSPIYETFLAFQRFCLLWAKQFVTSFEFTFMPELFPGGIVAFPEHGLQCYVEEVVHSGSYQDGFTTVAQLSAPSALRDADQGSDKDWIHSGMIRAFVNETVAVPKASTTQTHKAKPA